MNFTGLFRTAALEARQTGWLSNAILIRPASFCVLTAGAATCAALIAGFLVWGSYTQRSTVSGQLVPDQGLVKVYVPQSGIVLQKRVTEGQTVQTGDVLYVLSSERQSSTQGETQARISAQVTLREQSLHDEWNKTRVVHQEDRAALMHKIGDLQTEQGKLDSQIDSQKARVTMAEETVQRYQGLLAQDYVSKEQLQQKREDLLDQRNRQQGLERERISLGRELAAQQNDLASLALKQQNQLAQLERSMASVKEELTESEAKRRLVITAPQSGTAAAVTAEIGQAVGGDKPLLSIVPRGAQLQAHLYAPSRAVGFVKPGDAVLVRYQAYPYQKFGHAKGNVVSVSNTALPGGELSNISSLAGNAEPLYRVTVKLDAQTINAYGIAQPLHAGMLLEADVLQETRRLYEWVLEPLYSLTGKL